MKPIFRKCEIIASFWPPLCISHNPGIKKLLFLPVFLLFFGIFSFAQNQVSTFSFSSIPFSDPDIVAPFRGAERWHSSSASQMINNPTESAMVPPMDIYHRSSLAWDELESAQGVYNWAYFDQVFNEAISAKQRISFGIMTQNPGRTDGPFAGGAYMSYPLYLHNLMQAEATNSRDWISAEDAFWVPNYNSPNYLSRFEALLNAIAQHINVTSYNGVSYKDALGYVDIRGYGSWGEWHMVSAASNIAAYPAGRRPLASSLIRIIDAHITAFPNHPLVSIISTFDGNQFSNTMVPPEVGYHALTASNAWGKIGWRRDNWGWTDGYISNWLESNPTVYNGMRFDTALLNRWRYAPILGEGPCGGTNNGGPCAFWDVPRQVKLYHASMIGNGNFCNENTNDLRGRDSMRMAWKLSGYRVILEGGNMTTNLTSGGQMGITLNWKNTGIAPVYENWDVTYELQNQSNNAVAWSSSSTHKLKLWAPQANATVVNDNYTLPSNLPAGTYRLVLKIKDPLNYRAPFPLAIQGRRADGSYLLRADITLGAGTGTANNAPVANAGSDQTVVLPVSSVSLTGQGTDNDGTISSYLWSKVSGPVGGNIQNPATGTTNITGLNAGTYIFRLTVTDNQGAVGTDDIQILVNAAPAPSPSNLAPVVNAGPDQRLTAGVTSASFTGTAFDPDQAGGSQVNLIVMMGESNASGIAPNSSATARERAPRASVKILNNANFTFEDLDLDQNNNIDNATPWNESHSWEIGLADAVEAGLLPNPTYMVKAAASGTRIDQWLLNGGGTWWENMRNKMDQAIAQLRAQNRPYKITVWYSLGLNDAVQGTPAAVWRSRIEQFFRDFRAVYGANIQFYMTRFHEYADTPGDGLGHPYNPTIDAIDAADPLTFVVPTQGASYNPGERFVHFDYLGQKLIASRMVSAMRSNQGSGTGSITSVLWSKISGPNGATITSPNQLSTTVTGLQTGAYSFLLECADNLGAIGRDTLLIDVANGGSPPFANAGNDQTVTLPANTVTLNGSGTDPDGSITSFAWAKVSGPAGGNIQSPAVASTSITGLIQGTYVYRLTVTDNSGATATDDVQINVAAAPAPTPANQAPVANAGSDMVIALPANTVTLNGAGTDSDGSIASYSWTKVSGPAGGNIQNPNVANTVISGLNAGTYIFRLTVTDNNGASATDDVQVQVNTSLAPSPSNQAPLVNVGADIIISLPLNTVTLNGTANDPDGSVSSYSWAKLSGPVGGTLQTTNAANTNVTGLNAGVYVFRLTVTDNAGAQAFDDIQITVNAAPSPTANQLPIANGGGNKSITLPNNTITLIGTGTDPDGTISGYSWSKVSGPSGGNIISPNAATTDINGLNEGVYVFRLIVTDNGGASSSDDIQIIVNAAPVVPNTAPIANAGHDISITLPVNSVTLNGTASADPDGSIVSYSWRKIQGPGGSSLTSTNIASPGVNGLTRGEYEFELTVTDNRGATSTDRVLVSVIKINQKPVAKLARDTISVALPVQNAELSAIDSYDPDGVVTNYEWTYKKGPKEPKMLSPQSSKTIIADLVTGTYEFDLVVTDDDGAKDRKAVVVIVKNSSSRRLIPDVSVYPNPASNLVNVKISSDVEGRTLLTFIDMNGRPVMTDVFVKGYGSFTRQVNIGHLPKGAYTILIQVDQTEKVVEKMIKF